MPDLMALTARAAAARLAGRLDPKLPVLTEQALAGEGDNPVRSYDAGVSLALAGLLLSAVQFGWQIYRDLKEDRERRAEGLKKEPDPPLRTVLVRRLRLRLAEPRGLAAEQRDQLIEVVAEEILAIGEVRE